MIKSNQQKLNIISCLLDTLLSVLAFLCAFYLRFFVLPNAILAHSISFHILLALYFGFLHLIVNSLLGFYHFSFRSIRAYKDCLRVILSELICCALLTITFYMFKFEDISRGMVLIATILSTGLHLAKLIGVRLLLRLYRRRGYNLRHTLLIGSGSTAAEYLEIIRRHPEFGYHVAGYISDDAQWGLCKYLGPFSALKTYLDSHPCDEAIIALPAEDYTHIESIIHTCENAGAHISVVPCYDRYISSRMSVSEVDGLNLFGIRFIPLDQPFNAAVKRTMDIVGSLCLIVLTSPLMLIAAIGTRLSSPGPVIFSQRRVGRNKKEFMMYKFRSMRVNEGQDTAWSTNEDDRRTRFGSFLRKYSIDELPQFFNVLKGDMSLVGPRPEIPFYVDRFKDEIPLYMIKHYVRPGITGWAQVNGYRGDTSIAKRIEHDIYYIENWTLGFDLKILFLTLFRLTNDETIQK